MSNSEWCFYSAGHTTQPAMESSFHAVFMLEAEWCTSSLALRTCWWQPVSLLTQIYKCLTYKAGLKGTCDRVPLRCLRVSLSLDGINRRFWWGPWQLHNFFFQTAWLLWASPVCESMPQSLEKIKKRISTLETVNVQGGHIWFFKWRTSRSLSVIRILSSRPFILAYKDLVFSVDLHANPQRWSWHFGLKGGDYGHKQIKKRVFKRVPVLSLRGKVGKRQKPLTLVYTGRTRSTARDTPADCPNSLVTLSFSSLRDNTDFLKSFIPSVTCLLH